MEVISNKNPLYWENKKLESDYIDNKENLREEKYEKDKLRFSKLEKPDPRKFAPGSVVKLNGKFYKRDNREFNSNSYNKIHHTIHGYQSYPGDWDYHWNRCFYIKKLNFSVTCDLVYCIAILLAIILTAPLSIPTIIIILGYRHEPVLTFTLSIIMVMTLVMCIPIIFCNLHPTTPNYCNKNEYQKPAPLSHPTLGKFNNSGR